MDPPSQHRRVATSTISPRSVSPDLSKEALHTRARARERIASANIYPTANRRTVLMEATGVPGAALHACADAAAAAVEPRGCVPSPSNYSNVTTLLRPLPASSIYRRLEIRRYLRASCVSLILSLSPSRFMLFRRGKGIMAARFSKAVLSNCVATLFNFVRHRAYTCEVIIKKITKSLYIPRSVPPYSVYAYVCMDF